MARHDQVPLRRFERMSRLKNYTVEKGITDPRGWRVVDGSGQPIGAVTDLVVDTDRMAAAYLEVELDRKMFGKRDDPRILVPMTRAEREGGDRRVVVADLTRSRIMELFDDRARHEASFWEQWWRDDAALEPATPTRATSLPSREETTAFDSGPRAAARDEDVALPVDRGDRVEQRPVHPDERIVASGEIEESRIGRPAERVYRPPLGRPGDVTDNEAPRYRSRATE